MRQATQQISGTPRNPTNHPRLNTQRMRWGGGGQLCVRVFHRFTKNPPSTKLDGANNSTLSWTPETMGARQGNVQTRHLKNNFSWWCHAHASQWHPPFASKKKKETKSFSENFELWEMGGAAANSGNNSWRCLHGKASVTSLQCGLNVFLEVDTKSGVFWYYNNVAKYVKNGKSRQGEMMVVCVECPVLFIKKLERKRRTQQHL